MAGNYIRGACPRRQQGHTCRRAAMAPMVHGMNRLLPRSPLVGARPGCLGLRHLAVELPARARRPPAATSRAAGLGRLDPHRHLDRTIDTAKALGRRRHRSRERTSGTMFGAGVNLALSPPRWSSTWPSPTSPADAGRWACATPAAPGGWAAATSSSARNRRHGWRSQRGAGPAALQLSACRSTR